MNKDEIEAKFYLRDRPAYLARLQAAGAVLEHPRMLEQNLRFDLPDGSLMAQKNVLRLRQDRTAMLTFKGPTRPQQGVAVRAEIQFEVSDFSAADQGWRGLTLPAAALACWRAVARSASRARATPMRRVWKLSGLPNRRISVCGTRSASSTPSNTMPLASMPP